MSLTHILLGLLILFYIRFLLINWKIIKFSWHNRGFFLPVLPVVGSAYVALLTGKRRKSYKKIRVLLLRNVPFLH